MNYFGKIISNISQAYSEINPATLTGAIDVIVVEQEDGTFLTSPFHVRFGKMGVLRSKEKIVDIEINGNPVDIHMKLGDGGEAYFLEEIDDDDDDDNDHGQQQSFNDENRSSNNSNDSIPSINNSSLSEQVSVNLTSNNNQNNFGQNLELSKSDEEHSANNIKTDSANPSTPCSQKRIRRKKKCKNQGKQNVSVDNSSLHPIVIDVPNELAASENNLLKSAYSDSDLHPFSDSEAESKKQKDSFCQSTDYKSDSEIEIPKNEKPQSQDNISWDWGELPNVKKESITENKSVLGGVLNFMIKDKDKIEEDKGIYLDELDPNDMKPEVAAKYFPNKFRSSLSSRPNVTTSSDEDIESGNGPSLSNSPRNAEFTFSHSEMLDQIKDQMMFPGDLYSLSRTYHDMSMSLCGRIEDLIENPDNTERFLQSIISFDDFSENPLQILENPNLVIRMGSNYYSWKMASAMILSLLLFQRPLSEKTMNFLKDKCIPKKASPQNSRSWRSLWFRSPTIEPNQQSPNGSSTNNVFPNSEQSLNSFVNNVNNSNYSYHVTSPYENDSTKNSSIEYVSDEETYNSVVISHSNRNSTTNSTNKKNKYRKVLRLSSDVLKSLNLRPGSNDVMFSVTTAYQGTTASKSKIFLWRYDDKIIISDIDGTITKSDVLGHILPYIGKDWAQLGVTNLYSKVQQNGYKFLYLSARAIGQAKGTRDYLTSICQEGIYLPDGPLLLSPTSLFSALHREVIEKKPEEFKISCLKDIQMLFPTNPFYAGFGNKINDTWAYKAVGIDPSRIFTINHRGELKLDKMISFKSSYGELSQFVDQMFPPLNKEKGQDSENENFNSFLYWRTDIPELDEIELIVSK